jgi:hypothetical protein
MIPLLRNGSIRNTCPSESAWKFAGKEAKQQEKHYLSTKLAMGWKQSDFTTKSSQR